LKLIPLIAACLLCLGGCSTSPTNTGIYPPPVIGAAEIRVRNGTNVMLSDVVVGDRKTGLGPGAKKYGDIAPEETTRYQTFTDAYSYAFVSVYVGSKRRKIQPFCFTGEEPLRNGKFTYVLTIENDQLEIRAVRDTEK
jgi:hypothetical protein